MVPRLVPEISSLDAFCDGAGAGAGGAAGIGDSRSWIISYYRPVVLQFGTGGGVGVANTTLSQ